MRKEIITVVAASLLVSVVNAKETKGSVFATVSNAEYNSKAYTEYGIGQKVDKKTSSDFTYGLKYGINFGQVESTIGNSTLKKDLDIGTIEFDLKGGYEVVKDLELYVFGTGAAQYINSNMGYGFGFGGGVNYQLTDSLSLDASYRIIGYAKYFGIKTISNLFK